MRCEYCRSSCWVCTVTGWCSEGCALLGNIHNWSLECRDAARTGCCQLSWDPKVTLGGCFSSTEGWINFKAPNTKWEIVLPMRKALLWHKLACPEKICAVNHDELMSSCGLHVAATLASGILALNIWHLFPLCFCLSSCVWDIKVAWTRPLLCFVLWPVCQKQSLCEVFAESPASLCLVWRFWTRCFGPPGVTLSWSPAQHLVGTWDEKCDKISVSLQTVKPSWCLGRPGVLLWSALALCLFALWIFHVLLSSFGNIPVLERNRIVSQKWEGSFCASPSDQSRVWGCSGCALLIQGINLFIEDRKQQLETMGVNAFNY